MERCTDSVGQCHLVILARKNERPNLRADWGPTQRNVKVLIAAVYAFVEEGLSGRSGRILLYGRSLMLET